MASGSSLLPRENLWPLASTDPGQIFCGGGGRLPVALQLKGPKLGASEIPTSTTIPQTEIGVEEERVRLMDPPPSTMNAFLSRHLKQGSVDGLQMKTRGAQPID